MIFKKHPRHWLAPLFQEELSSNSETEGSKGKLVHVIWFALSLLFFVSPLLAEDLPLSEIDQRLITDIQIEGNQHLSDREIFSAVTLNVVPQSKTTLQEVRLDIQHLYLLGYFKDVDIRLMPTYNGMVLVYKVEENPVIGDVVFSGNTIDNNQYLSQFISTRKWQVLSYKKIENDIKKLEEHYLQREYSLFKVTNVSFGPSTNIVEFQFDEGVINDIKFVGNTQLRDRFIQRELRLSEGEVFNSRLLRRDREKILKLGYFSSVSSPGLSLSKDSNKVDITYELTERKINAIGCALEQGRIGINTVFNLKLNNYFKGAESITARAQFGEEKMYSLHYFTPWIGEVHLSLGLDRWLKINTERDLYSNKYRTLRNGWDVVLGSPFSDEAEGFLTWKSESISEYSDIPTLNPYSKNSLGVAFSYDSRSDPRWPVVGDLFYFDWSRGGKFGKYFDLGGITFIKYTVDYAHFQSFIRDQVLALHAGYGVYEPLSTGYPLLELDEFSIGGTYTVRGYSENAPQTGPRKIQGNAEYRVLFNDIFSVVVFYDVGSAYSKNVISRDLRIGKGLGCRFSTPIGPLRFDFAWSRENEFVFHFGLAEMF